MSKLPDNIADLAEWHRSHRVFDGSRTWPCLSSVAAVCRIHGACSLLDYGCGKGRQWRENVPDTDKSLQEYLGLQSVELYDPASEEFSSPLPAGAACDVGIVVDVLEYVPVGDVVAVLAHAFSHVRKAIFVNLTCCRPKKPCLPEENWERSPFFWLQCLQEAGRKYPEVYWYARIATTDNNDRELVRGRGGEVAVVGRGHFSAELPLW